MSAIWVLIGIVGVLGAVGALAVIAYLRTDGKKRPLQDLEEQVSAADGRAIGVTYTNTLREKDGTVHPATVRVTACVDEAHGGEGEGAYRGDGRARAGVRPLFVLRRETRLDRLGKRLGLCREIQTGDPVFDARVYVEADAIGGDVRAVLGDPAFRRAVLDLLDAGTHRVELDGKGLAAARTCAEHGEPVVESRAHREDRRAAHGRAGALPLFGAGRVARRRTPAHPPGHRRPARWRSEAPCSSGRGLVSRWSTREVRWPWVSPPVWSPGRFRSSWPRACFASRSDAVRRLGLFAGVAALGIPTGVYGGLLWANGALDTSAPVEHRTTVTGRWRTGGGTDHKGAARPSQGRSHRDLVATGREHELGC